RVSFTLDPLAIAWLKEQAELQGKSRSEILDLAITEAQARWQETSGHRIRIPIPQTALRNFCRRHHIQKLSLFGSVLSKEFGPDSDIDVLVEFDPERTPSLFDMVAMQEELSELFNGRAVDLKTAGELSRYFVDDVLRSAEVVYAA
ncbi:MAG: nucleotidyltransferase family protein, partial [Kiloniellales bacterium]|nr:nucleotidyltransferase family protein [Kiloniellales bacterium]